MDVVDGMKTFAATVEAGSFTAAADRLGISKKLASKYVAQLEDRLGVRLLHRTTRKLGLTSAGRRYYAECVDLLDRFNALEDTVRDDAAALRGPLRLSLPTSFGELYFWHILGPFRAKYPGISIEVRLSDAYVDLIDEGFDLGLRIGNLEASSIIARKLATTELWLVAADTYLDRHGVPKVPGDLVGHQCIRDANLRGGGGWPFEVDGRFQNYPVSGPYVVNNAAICRDLALEGQGIALCPDYVVAQAVGSGRLRRLLPRHPSMRLDVSIIHAEMAYVPARVRAFSTHLVDMFSRMKSWQDLLADPS